MIPADEDEDDIQEIPGLAEKMKKNTEDELELEKEKEKETAEQNVDTMNVDTTVTLGEEL